MGDSSIDEELFADNNIKGTLDDQDNQDFVKPPVYVETPEFKNFLKEHNISVHNRCGYIGIFLYRPYYFPGQTVRGYAVVDLFNDLPSP